MADNDTLYQPATGGTAVPIASDDIAGVRYQRVKNTFGADGSATDVSSASPMPAEPPGSGTATLTNVASSASSVQLLAANTARRGAIVVNDSTQTLYLKFGTTASATSYSYLLLPGAVLEFANPIYTGTVTGIWAAANGSARMTELT